MNNVTKISFNSSNNIRIYVDTSNITEILNFLFVKENYETFFMFSQAVFENRRNAEIYKKVLGVKGCDNFFEIRFRKGRKQNDRIYCKEIHDGARNIILAKLVEAKKTTPINKKILGKLKPICNKIYKL